MLKQLSGKRDNSLRRSRVFWDGFLSDAAQTVPALLSLDFISGVAESSLRLGDLGPSLRDSTQDLLSCLFLSSCSVCFGFGFWITLHDIQGYSQLSAQETRQNQEYYESQASWTQSVLHSLALVVLLQIQQHLRPLSLSVFLERIPNICGFSPFFRFFFPQLITRVSHMTQCTWRENVKTKTLLGSLLFLESSVMVDSPEWSLSGFLPTAVGEIQAQES